MNKELELHEELSAAIALSRKTDAAWQAAAIEERKAEIAVTAAFDTWCDAGSAARRAERHEESMKKHAEEAQETARAFLENAPIDDKDTEAWRSHAQELTNLHKQAVEEMWAALARKQAAKEALEKAQDAAKIACERETVAKVAQDAAKDARSRAKAAVEAAEAADGEEIDNE